MPSLSLCCCALLLSLLVFPGKAISCSPRFQSDDELFESSDKVFRGFVTNVEFVPFSKKNTSLPLTSYGTEDYPGGWGVVSFQLIETLKGEVAPDAKVLTWNFYLGGCGVAIPVGTQWLFFIEDIKRDTQAAQQAEVPTGSAGIVLPESIALHPNPEHRESEMDEWRSLANSKQ